LAVTCAEASPVPIQARPTPSFNAYFVCGKLFDAGILCRPFRRSGRSLAWRDYGGDVAKSVVKQPIEMGLSEAVSRIEKQLR
jgi:hypothetical protein